MKKILLYVCLAAIALVVLWFVKSKFVETKTNSQVNINLQKLHSVTKLVIFEQDFVLNDVETKEKRYLKWFSSKETVSTSVNGRMGFHIDLSDTGKIQIRHTDDTLFIAAPLQLTYISFNLASLEQTKDKSLDPTLEVSKEEILKHLDQKAIEKNLPYFLDVIREKSLAYQETQLSKLVGKPVRLSLITLDTGNNWQRVN
jgi:hypothetical protein